MVTSKTCARSATANFLGYLQFVELRDGGFALAGTSRGRTYFDATTTYDGSDPIRLYHFLLRTDAAGNDLWMRADGNGRDLRIHGLIEHPNGALGLVGSYNGQHVLDEGLPTEHSTPEIAGDYYRTFYEQFHADGAFGGR